ncbi:abortive infection system antitoxin AbiGi family protein [Ferrimonas senticii]|uniref:abortive infection system antitoxin AbiGi family protein n=1 Tax=Ferrimonas senticii TaxID=394566 RepID=UPI0004875ED4|nr:abortive infection system antitoxin AbiGi family protein [Ferrimonas senticii]
MAISASSLIHYTSSVDSLLGILKDGFKVTYCRESIYLNGHNYVMYIPMVSFCDIPLSQVKDHIKKYGNYGIGLTRDWATKSGLNPVLYIDSKASLGRCLDIAYDAFVHEQDGNIDDLSRPNRCFYDTFRYIKNYQADLIRKTETHRQYRFYDEREWRYVPPIDADCLMVMGEDIYNGLDKKELMLREKAMDKIASQKLKFDMEHISYLIINDDNEVNDLISFIREHKGDSVVFNDLNKLYTKILTVNQIFSDL